MFTCDRRHVISSLVSVSLSKNPRSAMCSMCSMTSQLRPGWICAAIFFGFACSLSGKKAQPLGTARTALLPLVEEEASLSFVFVAAVELDDFLDCASNAFAGVELVEDGIFTLA